MRGQALRRVRHGARRRADRQRDQRGAVRRAAGPACCRSRVPRSRRHRARRRRRRGRACAASHSGMTGCSGPPRQHHAHGIRSAARAGDDRSSGVRRAARPRRRAARSGACHAGRRRAPPRSATRTWPTARAISTGVGRALRPCGRVCQLVEAAAPPRALDVYEDTIRVAALKTRPIAPSACAARCAPRPQVLAINEFMHPRMAELLGLLPPGSGGAGTPTPAGRLVGRVICGPRRITTDTSRASCCCTGSPA